MNYRTHEVGGLLFGSATAVVLTTTSIATTNPLAILLVPVASVFGSLLPDLDKENTHASNRFPVLHKMMAPLGHRGMSHSLVVPLVFFIIALIIGTLLSPISPFVEDVWLCLAYGLIAGYISHICFDMITVMGVPLFMPLSDHYYSISALKNSRDGWKVSLFSLILEIPLAFLLIEFYFKLLFKKR